MTKEVRTTLLVGIRGSLRASVIPERAVVRRQTFSP